MALREKKAATASSCATAPALACHGWRPVRLAVAPCRRRRTLVAALGVVGDRAVASWCWHQQRRRQELDRHRPVPPLRQPGFKVALQGAEHEQQRAGGCGSGSAFASGPPRRPTPNANAQRSTSPGGNGSAQYFQALCAAVPDVRMNRCCSPEADTHSQVVLLGQVDRAERVLARAQRTRHGQPSPLVLDQAARRKRRR